MLPHGNVRELFFIASLNIKSGREQADVSCKSQIHKKRLSPPMSPPPTPQLKVLPLIQVVPLS